MARASFFLRNSWKIFGSIILLTSCFSSGYVFEDQISFANAQSNCAAGVSVMPTPNTKISGVFIYF